MHACCVFCVVFFPFNLVFIARYKCCWLYFWVDCISSLLGMLSRMCFPLLFHCIFLCTLSLWCIRLVLCISFPHSHLYPLFFLLVWCTSCYADTCPCFPCTKTITLLDHWVVLMSSFCVPPSYDCPLRPSKPFVLPHVPPKCVCVVLFCVLYWFWPWPWMCR